MKHKYTAKWLIILLLLGLIAVIIFFSMQFIQQQTQLFIPTDLYKTHLVGGFSVTTPTKARQAATEGVQVVFQYGHPPSESSPLGQTLRTLHMKVIDGFISSNLYYYECQRLRAKQQSPSDGLSAYCGRGTYPTFANENAFLATMATHLQQVANNHLIIGYWVLDDWASWDAGSARQLLIQVHHLIQRYSPQRVAICGLGAALYPDATTPGWNDETADNFSPQGCDRVGVYVYAASRPATPYLPPSEAYDWSMSTLLPAIFTSLQQRGWDSNKEPLIGIAQAFGGPVAHTASYRVVPTTKDIEMQSQSFCANGASGLIFYGWSDSEIGPTSLSPMNSSQIENGIRDGIRACMRYWNVWSITNDRSLFGHPN